MIYVATSNGVLVYDPAKDSIAPILQSSRKKFGFPGIALQETTGKIIVVERARLRFTLFQRLCTDMKVYQIDPNTNRIEMICPVLRVYDGHNTAVYRQYCFLTDTGRNRVHVADLETRKVVRILNIGTVRADIHHINSVRVWEDDLLIGLNNRQKRESEIMALPLPSVFAGDGLELTVDARSNVTQLPGIHHAHEIVPYQGRLIGCASLAGQVIRLDSSEVLVQTEGWVRGLAPTEAGLWVGISDIAQRKDRHAKENQGRIVLYGHETMKPLKTILLEGVGQISAMISL